VAAAFESGGEFAVTAQALGLAPNTVARSYADLVSQGIVVSRAGGHTVAVGYDGRLSSPALAAALVEGLRASGMEVLRVGRGPTPMLYFAATTLGTDGAVMVTGSHNPPDYNGLKIVVATIFSVAIS